ncbi:hypothetical protein BCR42DRAFT_444778 [Absidia repens]|uniref:Uncharacterized protein n=1 Tax=Absidia repens TaxID=90262 RepID=A0A1X2HDV2_9FUNG|nr:hypothetical protein BCR42DRAFT_444778 [Absidia repens]
MAFNPAFSGWLTNSSNDSGFGINYSGKVVAHSNGDSGSNNDKDDNSKTSNLPIQLNFFDTKLNDLQLLPTITSLYGLFDGYTGQHFIQSYSTPHCLWVGDVVMHTIFLMLLPCGCE